MTKRKKAAAQPPPVSRTGVSQDMATASLGCGGKTKQSWRLPLAHDAVVFNAADEAGYTAYLEEHGYCVIEVLTPRQPNVRQPRLSSGTRRWPASGGCGTSQTRGTAMRG